MLKEGDKAIVRPSERYNVHPVGTVVKIEHVSHITGADKPYYATNAEGGFTSYWYKASELGEVK